jgi:Outer membrane efflux protein
VLNANSDVENGLVTFLRAHQRTKLQAACVVDAAKAAKIAEDQYNAGAIPLTPLTLLQQNLVQQQDTLAQAQGEIALGLIQAYRAMGGGWQIRLTGCKPDAAPPAKVEQPAATSAVPNALPPLAPAAKPAPSPEPKPTATPEVLLEAPPPIFDKPARLPAVQTPAGGPVVP